MVQTFHKFRAETFDEAYQQMVRKLGAAAVVVNAVAERTEGATRHVFGLTPPYGPVIIRLRRQRWRRAWES